MARQLFRPGEAVAVPNIWRQQHDNRRWLPAVVVDLFDDCPDADSPWAVVRSLDRAWDLAIPADDLRPWRPEFGPKRHSGIAESH
jgi:hypothetical protein